MIDFCISIADRIIRFKSGSRFLTYDDSKVKAFERFMYRGKKSPDFIFDIRLISETKYMKKKKAFTDPMASTSSLALTRKKKLIFQPPDKYRISRIERFYEVDKDLTKGIIYVMMRSPADIRKAITRELIKISKDKEPAPTGVDILIKINGQKLSLFNPQVNPQGEHKSIISKYIKTRPPLRAKTSRECAREVMPSIASYFFEAFLAEYFPGKGSGFLAHCSSVYCGGKLYLFMGPSGAGKSSIADLWHKNRRAPVFNDDRALIIMRDADPYFYNAPSSNGHLNRSNSKLGNATRVDGIFFIRHNGSNILKRRRRVQAAAGIFQNSFQPSWGREGLCYLLSACAKISSSVPCYDLGFANNKNVVTFLEKELKEA